MSYQATRRRQRFHVSWAQKETDAQLVLLYAVLGRDPRHMVSGRHRGNWAAQRTSFSGDFLEGAVAQNRGRAYQRDDPFDRQRELMVMWAAFIAAASEEIVRVRRSG
jgi:hypothetical protein